MPTEIARATKNLSLGLMHGTSTTQDTVEPQHSATPNSAKSQAAESASEYFEYERQMRTVGYYANRGQYEVMQSAGITPAYSREMSNLGFGRPSPGILSECQDSGFD